MTDAEYERKIGEVQDTLRTFAISGLAVSDDDLVIMRRTVEVADSFGHIFDPTAYRRAMYTKTLERQRDLLGLFVHVRKKLREIFPGDAAFWDALQEAHRANEEGHA